MKMSKGELTSYLHKNPKRQPKGFTEAMSKKGLTVLDDYTHKVGKGGKRTRSKEPGTY